jgi:mannose-6-phosphate isomerase-like protein (cupin superfamily)
MKNPVSMTKAPETTSYEQWMRSEGIPIVRTFGGVEDTRLVERAPWPRMGGNGAFIVMQGLQESGFTGMYVVEIPAQGALNPERHVYEELMYVLQGRGTTEVWQEGGPKKTFEWGPGSLFAPPLNTWHRLYSVSSEPAILLGVTTAQLVMDLYHNPRFVFENPFVFTDRYAAEPDYFNLDNRIERNAGEHVVWETNFIADLRTAVIDNRPRPKGHGVSIMGFEIADNVYTGHLSEWPVGIYHKAHYHGPGAVILGLNSHGYVLLWPKELGLTPYQDGYGDQVIKLKWGEGAVYAPPNGWFHQHFNTGREAARHIAFRTGGAKYRMGFSQTERNPVVSVQKGGALLEYEDEDPKVRRDFEAALLAEGIACQMPTFAPAEAAGARTPSTNDFVPTK